MIIYFEFLKKVSILSKNKLQDKDKKKSGKTRPFSFLNMLPD